MVEFDRSLAAFATSSDGISSDMARRASSAFRVASEQMYDLNGPFWSENDERNKDLIVALRTGDLEVIKRMMDDPGSHCLFWGIDSLAKGCTVTPDSDRDSIAAWGKGFQDCLLRLGEAVGAEALWYPEANSDRTIGFDVDDLLDRISEKVGDFDFPNSFPNEFGIRTARGIASYRCFQAIYQAWRIICLSQLLNDQRIVEIGPGIGRTAYYAVRFGMRDFTTIDLPLGIVAQAAFLSRALGEDKITLPGEAKRQGCIRIETPLWFEQTRERFGIVINADSMTEMAHENAIAYASKIVNASRAFISINHEINAFRVHDLPPLESVQSQRFPYWMRKGYVEHHYLF